MELKLCSGEDLVVNGTVLVGQLYWVSIFEVIFQKALPKSE
jgi:hypothetical protein